MVPPDRIVGAVHDAVAVSVGAIEWRDALAERLLPQVVIRIIDHAAAVIVAAEADALENRCVHHRRENFDILERR